MLPYRLIRILGGAGLASLGGYMVYHGYTLQGGRIAVLGVVTLAESVRKR